jgi:hypothetical protein
LLGPLSLNNKRRARVVAELAKQQADYNATVAPHEQAVDSLYEHRAEAEVYETLASTVPTTLAGVLAAVAYAREWQEANRASLWDDDDQQAAFLRSIETALSNLAGGARA